MKIIELEVEGFRSLKHVVWKPGDLNVVIGPNASGKSNLLKVLEMLSASARGGLSKYILREGGMGAVVWDGRAEKLRIHAGTSLDEPEASVLDYDLSLARLGASTGYSIENERAYSYRKDAQCAGNDAGRLLDRHPGHAELWGEVATNGSTGPCCIGLIESKFLQETLLSKSDEQLTRDFVKQTIPAYRTNTASWCIYQDVRTDRDAPIRAATVARYEKRVDSDGQNLVPVLHTLYTEDTSFREEINMAMQAAFGDSFEELTFPPAADQRIQLRVRWKDLKTSTSAADLSDGTLRFLYLLAVLANPAPPNLVAIDEPETGLHPSMMPIIAEYAAHAARKTQVILTTHSPEFLDGFYKVATPTTTVVERRDGQTQLRVVSDKELAYWVNRYTMGELFRSAELEQME